MRRPAALALALFTALWPLAEAATPLLVLDNVERIDVLAADHGAVAFAVAPLPPRPSPNPVPVFPPVRIGSHALAASLVLGLWQPGEGDPRWLAALPDDVASGGNSVYLATGLQLANGRLWAAGGRNSAGEAIGRFWLARFDARRGKRQVLRRDRGAAAEGLALAGEAVYLLRNAPQAGASGEQGVASLGRLDGWRLAIHAGPAGSAQTSVIALHQFLWPTGAVAANPQGVWAFGRFSGRIQVAGRSLDSPRPADLPLRSDLPPDLQASLRAMFRRQPLPPLEALLILHADNGGRLRWLARVAPGSVRLGESFDPARVEGGLLTVAADGTSYLASRYHLAVQSGDLRLERVGEAPDGCFLAAWAADGQPRWLHDLPCGDGRFLALGLHGDALWLASSHHLFRIDPASGTVRGQRQLPTGEVLRPPGIRWQRAAIGAGRLHLAGIAGGEIRLQGRRLTHARHQAVLLSMPLEAHQ